MSMPSKARLAALLEAVDEIGGDRALRDLAAGLRAAEVRCQRMEEVVAAARDWRMTMNVPQGIPGRLRRLDESRTKLLAALARLDAEEQPR